MDLQKLPDDCSEGTAQKKPGGKGGQDNKEKHNDWKKNDALN